MSRARPNPIGLRAQPGQTLVRVGSGEHTHLLAQGIHLCKSGLKEGVMPPLYVAKDAEFITCYRCIKELRRREGQTKTRVFSPSYPSVDQRDYDQQAEKGPKSWEHTLVTGGRQNVRYGQTAPQTEQRKRKSEIKEKRLQRKTPPWEARTQSPSVWIQTLYRRGFAIPESAVQEAKAVAKENPKKLDSYYGKKGSTPGRQQKINKIRTALEELQKQQPLGDLGLYVPPFVGPLLDVGLAPKVAHVLVGRAGGRFFATEETLEVPSANTFAELLRLNFASRPYVGYLPDGSVSIDIDGFGAIKRIEVITKEQTYTLVTASRIDRWHVDWVYEIKKRDGRYFADVDDPLFVKEVLKRVQLAEKGRALGFRISFSSRKEPVELRFSRLQHSNDSAKTDKQPTIRYRTLENVSLSRLPELLLSITERKKREGRRLTPLNEALENPMSDWDDQYSMGPYGPSQSIPAARRNRGRPRKAGRSKMEAPAWDNEYVRLTKRQLEARAKKGDRSAKVEIERRELLRSTSTTKGDSKRRKQYKAGSRDTSWNEFQKMTPGMSQAQRSKAYKAFKKSGKMPAKAAASKSRKAAAAKPASRKSASGKMPAVGKKTWPQFATACRKAGFSLQDASKAWRKVHPKAKSKSAAKKNPHRLSRSNYTPAERRALRVWNRAQSNPIVETPGSFLASDPWHPVYEQVIGQFGVSEEFTDGLQPVNRRNPKKRRKTRRK